MPEITPGDVSVVIQGPVSEWTVPALEAVARHLPDAQVVLSTWRGDVPAEAQALAVVVASEDPGGGPVDFDPHGSPRAPMNTERMFVSSRAGLARAERPYVLRMRSDVVLTGPSILEWWPLTAPSARTLFSRRLLTCSVATRPAASQVLFHLSDCLHFGPLDDVRALWSASEEPWRENVGFWAAHGQNTPWAWDARYANEQLLWLDFLRTAGVEVAYPFIGAGHDRSSAELSDRLLAENFVVLEPWQLGIELPKLQPVIRASHPAGYVFFEDWLRMRRGVTV